MRSASAFSYGSPRSVMLMAIFVEIANSGKGEALSQDKVAAPNWALIHPVGEASPIGVVTYSQLQPLQDPDLAMRRLVSVCRVLALLLSVQPAILLGGSARA